MFTGDEAPWKLEHFCIFGSPIFLFINAFRMETPFPSGRLAVG
jgi:hypothetical protein